ncbi:hypothetical protein GGQ64_004823 [Rhizobium azooxidifex]|uniref:TniQ domain-containing protein n=1 Tax=Mycoplana azooxidifex TaxID=1636188 RepID=A0A7W6GN38_9HYPH|nr:TniQ family protein [Mycoplana azooxidifex]MBB3979579.1 hypothetical protein [Mycoplana azooxidifex]
MRGLLRVPFFADELLLSFLARTAAANGRLELRHFCSDLGLDFRGIVRGESAATAAIASALEYPTDLFEKRRLALLGSRCVRFGGETFFAGIMSYGAVHYCPECIAEDDSDQGRLPGTRRYMRTVWSLHSAEICTRHSRRLVTVRETAWSARSLEAYVPLDQSFSYVRPSASPERIAPNTFDIFVSERLSGYARHGPVLDALSLSACIELSPHVGMASIFGRSYSHRKPDFETLRRARMRGHDVLREGESGIQDLLDKIAPAFNADSRNCAELYGGVFDCLGRRPSAYKPVRAILAAHAMVRYPRLSPGAFPGCTEALVPIETISKVAGVSLRTTCTYLRQHGLIGSRVAAHGKELVDAEIAHSAMLALRNTVDGPEACALLGCSPGELRSLVVSGFLIPLVGSARSPSPSKNDLYLRTHLEILRVQLISLAGPGKTISTSLRTAVRDAGCEVGDALTAILGGRIPIFEFDCSKPLLGGLRVETSMLVGALGLEGLLGGRKAREFLQIDQSSLKKIVSLGIVSASIDNQGNPANFHRNELASFARRYVALRSLARANRIASREMRAILLQANITPAFPPSQVNGMIFHRPEIHRRFSKLELKSADIPTGIGDNIQPALWIERRRRVSLDTGTRRPCEWKRGMVASFPEDIHIAAIVPVRHNDTELTYLPLASNDGIYLLILMIIKSPIGILLRKNITDFQF